MKIRVKASSLQKKLTYLNHAVSSKTQLPILSNILIRTEKNKVILEATDLEIGIQDTLQAIIEEEGGTTLPAKTFTELISSLSDEEMILQTIDSFLEVSGKRTKSVFQTTPVGDFPKLYEDKGLMISKIATESLHKNFSSIVFAASVDTARPQLSGVYVKKEEKGFLLVATDGYRLSLRHYKEATQKEEGESSFTSMIVPARVFREVLAQREGKDMVEIYMAETNNQILFQHGETVLVGRLIEGEFPNYERIIPTESSVQASFDREELLKAVKICSIFAREAANIIKLSLQKSKITVSSQTPSVGENTVEVEVALVGEENEIAFNARYLLDVLSSLEDENMVFEMTGPLNPGVFKIKGDDSFLHLIMPIRIQQ